jgi:hypothetical protein
VCVSVKIVIGKRKATMLGCVLSVLNMDVKETK